MISGVWITVCCYGLIASFACLSTCKLNNIKIQ